MLKSTRRTRMIRLASGLMVVLAAFAPVSACGSDSGGADTYNSGGADTYNSGGAPGSWDDSKDVVSPEEFNKMVCDRSGNAGDDC